MASTTDTLPFSIEQVTGQNPIKVELKEHDAPFGSARKGGMFELGGKNEHTTVRLDGRPTPIIHTKYTVWTPNVVKGHLRDHFTGVDGHGLQIVKDLQDILDAQQQVKLTCGPWTWTAFPDEFKLPVEGLNDFTYELHFEILSRPGYKPPPRTDSLINPYPTDLTAEIQAELADAFNTLLAMQIAVDIEVALTTMVNTIDQSLSDAVAATTNFENADLPGLAAAVAMGSAAEQVSSNCGDLIDELAALSPATALAEVTEDQAASFQASVYSTMALLDECQSRMWSVKYTANKRVRAVSKIYVVALGDTPDSIAQRQLGSAARISDLNLRPQDCVVGRRIRIPAQ